MAEMGGVCYHCAQQGKRGVVATVIDHRIPAWAEGVDFYDRSNLVPS